MRIENNQPEAILDSMRDASGFFIAFRSAVRHHVTKCMLGTQDPSNFSPPRAERLELVISSVRDKARTILKEAGVEQGEIERFITSDAFLKYASPIIQEESENYEREEDIF